MKFNWPTSSQSFGSLAVLYSYALLVVLPGGGLAQEGPNANQPTINPNDWSLSLRTSLCGTQVFECDNTCAGRGAAPLSNTCDADTLRWTCTCGDGTIPDFTNVEISMYTFECVQAYDDCAAASRNPTALNNCKIQYNAVCPILQLEVDFPSSTLSISTASSTTSTTSATTISTISSANSMLSSSTLSSATTTTSTIILSTAVTTSTVILSTGVSTGTVILSTGVSTSTVILSTGVSTSTIILSTGVSTSTAFLSTGVSISTGGIFPTGSVQSSISRGTSGLSSGTGPALGPYPTKSSGSFYPTSTSGGLYPTGATTKTSPTGNSEVPSTTVGDRPTSSPGGWSPTSMASMPGQSTYVTGTGTGSAIYPSGYMNGTGVPGTAVGTITWIAPKPTGWLYESSGDRIRSVGSIVMGAALVLALIAAM